MESIKEKIQEDLNQAVKRSDEIARTTLRGLLAAILAKEKEKRYKISQKEPKLSEKELSKASLLTNEEIIEVVSSEIKKRKDAISDYEKGNREDLAKKEKAEVEILQDYLPEQLPKEELEKLAREAIKKVGAKEIKDMGKVMSELMPKVKGKAEGGEISSLIKKLLSGAE